MAAAALIDTSALLALANSRDQYHDRAVSIAGEFLQAGGQWTGTVLVLAEFHRHTLCRLGSAPGRTLLNGLLADPVYKWLEVSRDLVGAAASNWLERYRDQKFSLTDAVSFEIMRREKLTEAFAFDEGFVVAGFRLIG